MPRPAFSSWQIPNVETGLAGLVENKEAKGGMARIVLDVLHFVELHVADVDCVSYPSVAVDKRCEERCGGVRV